MQYTTILKNTVGYPDEEIIKIILSGTTAPYQLLIRRYNPFLYKTGRAYGFNHQDTEDLMQETYINAYQHLAQFEGRSSFKTWIIRIMLNECYHKTHRQAYKKEILTDDLTLVHHNAESMYHSNNQHNTTNAVMNKELAHIIEAMLHKLPQEYRITFSLRELSGLSVAETADVMHTTTTNVKVRLSRAKGLLRKEIEKIYSPEDIYEFNRIYCDAIVKAVMQKIEN